MWRRDGERSVFSPEQLQLEISSLALERQRLREVGGGRELLEMNRLEIGRCQYSPL